MSKALLIHSASRMIHEVEQGCLADLQLLVGGYIETACTWPSGDVLFVDRLSLRPNPQPFVGDGGRQGALHATGFLHLCAAVQAADPRQSQAGAARGFAPIAFRHQTPTASSRWMQRSGCYRLLQPSAQSGQGAEFFNSAGAAVWK